MWQSFPLGDLFFHPEKERSRIVFFAGVAAQEVIAVVQEQMPIAVVGKFGIRGLLDEIGEIRVVGRLSRRRIVAMPRSTNVSAINRSMLIHASHGITRITDP